MDLNFYGKQGASVQSGQGADNNLTNLEEEDDEDLEAQLLMLGKTGQSNLQPAAGGSRATNKKLADLENRQKIFEDEIIKRIKEIQRYTKSIHLQVKKGA
jgi:hypothetical protein